MDETTPDLRLPGRSEKIENMQLEEFVGKLKGYMKNN